ncbi:uncharacterized protein LOC112342160 [Selaginella moellendorffii]|uniref:uncharacterized protein LOC112342160 n=1 Tax=Selaginella moellendorffii TaxID=88036 RepID=UPI000D1CB78B|nr:uncharacterized protein LOC112342160 [Selaginella moellendorffii]|eukprot:XP_024519303.1 uncharacterized protein LOC112342160 [Selaginella moellendorffii]
MAWWKAFTKPKEEESSSAPSDHSGAAEIPCPKSESGGVVSSTVHAVQDATTAATDAAVGAEQREAIRMENREIWGRIKEGDTLWGLSEKYLGDATKWPHLHAACRKELGPDPLRLLPGTHITEACIARARESSRKSRN